MGKSAARPVGTNNPGTPIIAVPSWLLMMRSSLALPLKAALRPAGCAQAHHATGPGSGGIADAAAVVVAVCNPPIPVATAAAPPLLPRAVTPALNGFSVWPCRSFVGEPAQAEGRCVVVVNDHRADALQVCDHGCVFAGDQVFQRHHATRGGATGHIAVDAEAGRPHTRWDEVRIARQNSSCGLRATQAPGLRPGSFLGTCRRI